jgi:hypothetical protein
LVIVPVNLFPICRGHFHNPQRKVRLILFVWLYLKIFFQLVIVLTFKSQPKVCEFSHAFGLMNIYLQFHFMLPVAMLVYHRLPLPLPHPQVPHR